MNKRILTIAIPTYNRPDSIKCQINALVPQLTECIEVLIIDNFSSIPVREILSDKEREGIRIIRNNRNIGADANIAKCFDECKTKWLWTLSDDDLVMPDAVHNVLQTIHQYDNALFIGFNNNNEATATGLMDFCTKYENYQRLFWMSVCVYNVAALAPYMHYYHYSISTMQPGVILLIKALESNECNTVTFSSLKLIDDGGVMISWDREDFFYATLFVFDILRKEKTILNTTLFHSIAAMLYYNVRLRYRKQHSISGAFKYMGIIVRRRGIWPSMTIDLKSICKTIWRILFNNKAE